MLKKKLYSYLHNVLQSNISSRLMPMLEPEYVAEEVVAGVLANETLIVLPNILRYLLPFKR